ncbi:MAG: nitroreductase family protein, partial [Eggerthellaceae bacterium]|nr:nitroreductase family protein [Eggerthellaceae bacterium]
MDLNIITTRRSIRTFDGRPLEPEHRAQLEVFARGITNPYGIPVTFAFFDAAQNGLSSPVITGETLYMTAKVPRAEHAEEAYGISFEKLVLAAWELGIGTTWIGGTMDRALFERVCEVGEGEMMCCMTPLGYPAARMSLREAAMRKGIGADKRMDAAELFFAGDFATPLRDMEPAVAEALKAVQWAPSAVNRQPWRVVRVGDDFHFFEKRDLAGGGRYRWDVQKIDVGIA